MSGNGPRSVRPHWDGRALLVLQIATRFLKQVFPDITNIGDVVQCVREPSLPITKPAKPGPDSQTRGFGPPKPGEGPVRDETFMQMGSVYWFLNPSAFEHGKLDAAHRVGGVDIL